MTSCLIVGSRSGVGEALARRLVGESEVVGWSRGPQDPLDETRWEHQQVDVTDYGAVTQAFSTRNEPFWAVVYCAAIARWGRVGEQDPSEWVSVIQANLIGAYHVLDAHYRRWEKHPERVVLIGSEASQFGRANRSAYHASKAALASFADSYRLELREGGGVVTLVSPGRIETALSPRNGGEVARVAISPEAVAEIIEAVLMTPHPVLIRQIEICHERADFGG